MFRQHLAILYIQFTHSNFTPSLKCSHLDDRIFHINCRALYFEKLLLFISSAKVLMTLADVTHTHGLQVMKGASHLSGLMFWLWFAVSVSLLHVVRSSGITHTIHTTEPYISTERREVCLPTAHQNLRQPSGKCICKKVNKN